MKICILVPGNIIGGGVKMPVRLASHLVDNHDVTIMYPVIKHYVYHHKLVKRTLLHRMYHLLRELKLYRRWFVFEKDLDRRVHVKSYWVRPHEESLREFDAIIYQSVWQYYELKDLRLPGVKKIHWSLADYLFCNGLEAPVDAILEAYGSGDLLVAPSKAVADNLNGYGFPVAGIAYGGVDPIFHARGRSWEKDPPSILGYFQPAWWVKGGATLIQCFRRLRKDFPEIRIEMFGHQNSAIDKTGGLVCDRFHTGLSSEEVADLCRRHDIFVYPSYSDGFQSPPLEAMACGCAVVATRIGAAPEYALHEQNALLCEPMNCQAMYENVIRLIAEKDLRVRLGRCAAEDAKKWRWQNCSRKFESILTGRGGEA